MLHEFVFNPPFLNLPNEPERGSLNELCNQYITHSHFQYLL